MLEITMPQSAAAITRCLIAGAALLACMGAAEASTITGTINTGSAFSPTNGSTDGVTYFGAPRSGPFPASAVTIGEFDFTVPSGQGITGATLSGDFGSNILASGTSQVDLFLNGIAVASCAAACESNSQVNDVAWTYTLSNANLSSLVSGKAILTAVQQSASQIVLDPTSMTVQTSPVPLPGALVLLGSGLAALFGLRRTAVAPLARASL